MEKSQTAEKPLRKRRKTETIAVDLDGTLAGYETWDAKNIGEPLDGAREFLIALKSAGFRILIYSVRTNCNELPPTRNEVDQLRVNLRLEGHGIIEGHARGLAARIETWLSRHGMPYDEVYVGEGKPRAAAYVDDHAVECRPQDEGRLAFSKAKDAISRLSGIDV